MILKLKQTKSSFNSSEITDSSPKTFICDVCGEEFQHRNSIIYHLHSKHSDSRVYSCSKCGKEFSSPGLLNKHFKRIHAIVRLFECAKCHAAFTGNDDLRTHLVTCNWGTRKNESEHECLKKPKQAKEFRCSICCKVFPYSSNLYRHEKLHSNERPYECEKCNRKFPTSSRLKMHINEHQKEYTFKCDICQKSFVNKRVLQIHSLRHTHAFPFQCEICKKCFPEKFTLVKHLRIHTGERPFQCDVCGRSFSDRSNYSRHKKKHVENENPPTKKSFRKKIRVPSKLKIKQKTQNSHSTPKKIIATKPLMRLNVLEEAIESILQEYDNQTPSTTKLTPPVIPQKLGLPANNTKPNTNSLVLVKSKSSERNILLIPSPLKKTNSNASSLRSVKCSNSYVTINRKANLQRSAGNNDAAAKLILIKNVNTSKSKILMHRSLKELAAADEKHHSAEKKQIPELYAYEELAPSPVSSECIDVEDLVATFTPNISFEEIGDLKDLINAKIDL